MTVTMGRRKRLLTAAVVLGTLAISCAVTAQMRPVTVQFSVDTSETALEIDTPSQCRSGGDNGCVEALPGERIRIQLVLGSNETCSSGGTWGLSEVYLGGEDSPGKPSSWGNLNKATADFDVDPVTGLVTPENGSNRNQIKFSNQNSQAYDVWYKVTATCGSRTIESDPRVRNGGVGN